MSSTFWDERYGAASYVYGREPNDFVRAEAERISPGPVLCLAEGEGRNAVFLAERGHAVTAVDFSREGLRKATELARERGVTIETELADLAQYEPREGAYTGVIAIWAHLPREIRRRVHGWVARALRPGGVFLLEAYTPDQIELATGGPKDPAMLMTLADLREELVGLQIDVGREVRREIHEGPFHDGPSATVQIAAHRP
ncbi:MAG: cyclopropane-fatty-acyl-phospholipid synthase family protein [Kofleriaceae bacterium]